MLKKKTARNASLVAKQEKLMNELRSFSNGIKPEFHSMSGEVVDILRYVHQHIFESGLSVGRVKRECQIRNNNISGRFCLTTGLTIRGYIEWLRLYAAGHLLHRADVEIYIIATAVGYHHLETFYRAFKRMYGCTPLEYRIDPRQPIVENMLLEARSLSSRVRFELGSCQDASARLSSDDDRQTLRCQVKANQEFYE